MSALGKGLSSLIPKKNNQQKSPAEQPEQTPTQPLAEVSVEELPKNDSVFLVEIDKIKPNPYQPRQIMDGGDLLSLASSIKEHGVLQPLVVSKKIKESDRGQDIEYDLIAGHRRLEAAKMAGLPHVPVVVRTATNQQKLEIALIENIQRADLNAIEKAKAFAKLQEEFGLTHAQIGKKIGKSRESVSNTLRLLNLPGEVQQAVIEGKISEGHARGIAGIKDRDKAMAVFRETVSRGMSVREVEERAKEFTVKEHKRKTAFLSELKEYQENLVGYLGYPVQINKSGVGGKLVIPFKDKDDLENLIKRITS